MKKYLLLFVSLLSVLAYATAVSPQKLPIALNLSSLKAVKTTESGGDELYITVTVYPSQGRPTHYHVPERPMHWLSKTVNKIHNLELWKGELDAGQSARLVVSLIEEDAPPFNPDDLIGTVYVEVKNDNGKLVSTWSNPNNKETIVDAVTNEGPGKKLVWYGDGGDYEANFTLLPPVKQTKP